MVYDLFFTTERVIAANIQHPSESLLQHPPVWQTLLIGSGWSSRLEKQKQYKKNQEKRGRLKEMTPDELLGEHSRNSEIRYSDITSVEIKRGFFQSQLRFHLSGPSTPKRTARFYLNKKQIPEAQRLLELTPLSESQEE